MTELTYYDNPRLDKSEWPEGEWDNEPDKVQWRDEATGYPCLAVRNRWGALCGYVGVPPGHRFHGVDYGDVVVGDDSPNVHGGLTFAGGCDEEAPEGEGICHIPEPGELDDVFWLGFDCGHGFDVQPRMLAQEREWAERHGYKPRPDDGWQTYKNLAFVKSECAQLAIWLKEVDRGENPDDLRA